MTKHRSPKSRKAIVAATFGLMTIVFASPTFAIAGSSSKTWQLKSPTDRIQRLPSESDRIRRRSPANPDAIIRPTPTPSPTPPPPAPQVRYRVKMWFKIDDANDGFADNTIECYGSLRINGDLYWNIPREHSGRNQREAGQELQVSNSPYALRQFIFNTPTIDYEMILRDADEGSEDDYVYRPLPEVATLNLELIAGSPQRSQTIRYFNPLTQEISRLYVHVELI
jgi:hypothetical protein